MFAPSPSAAPVAWLLLAPASLGLVWLTGHLAGRSLPSPCRPATDLLCGLLILFFTAFGCDAVGLRIGFGSLAAGLAVAAIGGAYVWRRRALPPPRLAVPAALADWRSWPREVWWALPCLFVFGSVLVRGVVDPLAGWDNLWRWNQLALVLHDTGSLAAYPPVSAADFLAYPWAEGIPPLVAVLNAWIYFCSGSTNGGLIVFRLAAELLCGGILVWRLARELWGPLGARIALLALAASALFLASVSIAQETGLAGLGVLVLVVAAVDYRRTPSASAAAWMAVGAAFSALCRDYNLLLPLVALGLLLWLRPKREHLLLAILVTGVLVAPWYARNWLLTGNPLYAHALGGLFPTNAYHDYHMGEIRRFWAPSATWDYARWILGPVLAGTGVLLVAALPGLAKLDTKRRGLLLVPIAAVIALWAISLGSTAGGVVFALRVLGPALPLLAVAAGWWATRSRPARMVLSGILILGAADAARRHWLFQFTPLAAPLPYAWTDWHRANDIHARFSRDNLWPALHAQARGDAIVADNPGHTVHAARRGVPVHPLTSPALHEALDSSAPATAEEVRASLRAVGVRFVVLGEDTTFLRELHGRHPRLGALYATPPAWVFEGLRVYDLLHSPAPAAPALP